MTNKVTSIRSRYLMNKFKNYIFDMDGTIWDSAVPAARGFTEAVKLDGRLNKEITVADIHANFGKTLYEIADTLFAELPKNDAVELIRHCVQYQYKEMNKCVPEILYPDLETTLQSLKDIGCGLFIISNCLDGYIDILFNNTNLQKYFTDVAWLHHPMDSKAANIKHFVDTYKLENPCYVGDIQSDYIASTKAGIPFIHAAYGFGKVPEAEYRINTFKDLLNF